jgi:hypothetical protein
VHRFGGAADGLPTRRASSFTVVGRRPRCTRPAGAGSIRRQEVADGIRDEIARLLTVSENHGGFPFRLALKKRGMTAAYEPFGSVDVEVPQPDELDAVAATEDVCKLLVDPLET